VLQRNYVGEERICPILPNDMNIERFHLKYTLLPVRGQDQKIGSFCSLFILSRLASTIFAISARTIRPTLTLFPVLLIIFMTHLRSSLSAASRIGPSLTVKGLEKRIFLDCLILFFSSSIWTLPTILAIADLRSKG